MIHLASQFRRIWVVLATAVFTSAVHADVQPFSGAEVAANIAIIRVEYSGVRVELEIYPADLQIFADTIPEEILADLLLPSDAGRKVILTGRGGLSIERTNGTALAPQFVNAERRERIDRASPLAGQTDPMTGRVVPFPPEDPEVIYLELFYTFEGTRPEAIVIHPPYADEYPAASIGFMVYDRSVPVSRFSFLSRDAQLRIGWSDPWFSAFTNSNLNRSARKGTTSHIYVVPREIRHEILIRARELGPWIGHTLATDAMLAAEQQSLILNAAFNKFKEHNPMSIEGVPVEPVSVRGAFLTVGERGFQVVEGTPTLEANSAFVGVILSYPISVLPAEASITWDMFDDVIQEVPVVLTDDAGPFLDWASPDDPEVTWTNHLKRYVNPQVSPVPTEGILFVPIWTVVALVIATSGFVAVFLISNKRLRTGLSIVAVVCLAAGFALTGARSFPVITPFAGQSENQLAEAALSGLLANVYVAALEVSPEARSAALDPIASEAALTELAAELETNLAIRVPGGGLARVGEITEVVVDDGGMSQNGTFQGIAQWTVDARAGHWGHDHRRRVRYRARVEFRPENGHWTFAALTVLEARSPDA